MALQSRAVWWLYSVVALQAGQCGGFTRQGGFTGQGSVVAL